MTGSSRKRRAGRPADSLAAAFAAVEAGTAPGRPRNEFERAARPAAGGRGRKPRQNSPTRAAAELAAYLVARDGLSLAAAARQAAAAWNVNADNVRRYARAMLRAKTVTVTYRGHPWMPVEPRQTPFVVEIRDIDTTDFIPTPPDADHAPNLPSAAGNQEATWSEPDKT